MAKIETGLPLPGDEAIMVDEKYKIKEVEGFTSDVQSFRGYRVILQGPRGTLFGLALWARDVASKTSKLGSFISVLGTETDDWIGKNIVFKVWQERNRQIELAK